jgi:hypothetical protein
MPNPAQRTVFVGKGCALFDQYDRPRVVNWQAIRVDNGDEHALFNSLPADNPVKLLDEKGDRAWGIEFCALPYEGTHLVPMINHLKQSMTVKLQVEGAAKEAIDLLSHETVAVDKIELKPMEPLLLRLDHQ